MTPPRPTPPPPAAPSLPQPKRHYLPPTLERQGTWTHLTGSPNQGGVFIPGIIPPP